MIRPFALLSLVVALGASAQQTQERRDHRGSLGVIAAGSGARTDFISGGVGSESGFRAGAELGATLQLGHDDDEALLSLHGLFGGPAIDLSIRAGWRGYFGHESWKTFVDLQVATHVTPRFLVGPRVGLGVQLDFLPIAGAFFVAGAEIGLGQGIRFGADLALGVQLRSYLFE